MDRYLIGGKNVSWHYNKVNNSWLMRVRGTKSFKSSVVGKRVEGFNQTVNCCLNDKRNRSTKFVISPSLRDGRASATRSSDYLPPPLPNPSNLYHLFLPSIFLRLQSFLDLFRMLGWNFDDSFTFEKNRIVKKKIVLEMIKVGGWCDGVKCSVFDSQLRDYCLVQT